MPVRPLLSVAVAGFSLLLAFGLVIGAQATRPGFSVVVGGAQVLFVLAWTVGSRPPAPWLVGSLGVLAAVAATVTANLPVEASLAPLGYVIAGGFVAAIVGQLALRGRRAGVTESLGATMTVVIGVVAFAAPLVLIRQPLGTQVLMAGLISAGVALAAARIFDIVMPGPRLAPQVPRGAVGVLAGAVIGAGAAAATGYYLVGLHTLTGAATGMVAALTAVTVDLAVSYAEAGQQLEGEAPFMWLARHMQGPLGAFAFTGPACYVVSVMLA